jgi:hypothetical protein
VTPDPPERDEEERLEDLELEDAEDVTGGQLASPPAGPVPIPYPNVHE